MEVSLSFTKCNPASWSKSRGLDNLKGSNSKKSLRYTECSHKIHLATILSSTAIYFLLIYFLNMWLSSRIQNNHLLDQQNMVISIVEKLEPLSLRIKRINNLAQTDAFLESLNVAHGDLRPENIQLDRNRLKLSDSGCTAKIGTFYEGCAGPYST
ncbi:hypothetical protein N7520_009135 [Penicillium odoratum]|uniref:uncharacterized protein n=1 Tax=Penicillium odoratum TaxID=1167516 RepID=UPI002549555A|nr:uncharacterized protein N7520_009135 [Penicillium odoratum]KAJ5752218.1 hypothetical protein N7520_009135 [Penicillium odoratum]